ncbi:MAG TPA: hypothetical protein VL172_11595 [Kofleriaceae bacterium]|nr:hypothetical protein [Kofleriaceae bacterium]
MAPRLRSEGRRRRRIREWAAPFVITVALSPACTRSTGEKTGTKNPPPPMQADAGAAATPPPAAKLVKRGPGDCVMVFPDNCAAIEAKGGDCNPPRPEAVPCPDETPPPAAVSMGDISRAGDKCTYYMNPSCPPNVPCNPPPPMNVACPPELKDNAAGRVSRLPDGSCELMLHDGGKTSKIACPE